MDRIFHQDITAMMIKVWMEKIDAVLSLAKKEVNNEKFEKTILFLDEKTQKGTCKCIYLMLVFIMSF